MPGFHLLGMADLNRADIEWILGDSIDSAFRPWPNPFVAGLMFLEDSTRTRVGFDVAVSRLGGRSVAITSLKQTDAMSARESWTDTLLSIGPYFDLLCIRHGEATGLRQAAELLPHVAVVNCGNGADEHPTQALIDLRAITEHFGRLPDRMTIGVVGDLRHMRAAHSLLLALARFDSVCVVAASPPELQFPAAYVQTFVDAGNTYVQTAALEDALQVDVLYMAGFAPKTPMGVWDEEARSAFRLTERRARRLPRHASVLCPLPRVDEIEDGVDLLPQARYFHQSALGVDVRTAVLRHVLRNTDAALSPPPRERTQ